jgi:SAM-dependent methyltransferase
VTDELFNRNLRRIRRDRASVANGEPFLAERAFDECLDRLRDVARPFRDALLIGCPDPSWPCRLGLVADHVEIVEPGECFAAAVAGTRADEDHHDYGEGRFDLCLAVGTLDTVNDLPLALHLIHRSLRPDGLLIGAMAGGNSLPTLRAALIEAGREEGRVSARTNPRIEAPALAQLLSSAGFQEPVVDVDRVRLRYDNLADLVRDLRAMAATAILSSRAPGFTKTSAARLASAFASSAVGGRTAELVEILHFTGWKGATRQVPD